VEKVFRIVPAKLEMDLVTNPMKVDRIILQFLEKHFKEYEEFFGKPGENDPDSQYVYFNNMMEDKQVDDLTFIAYERR
jgi:hypothetical protein